MGVDNTWSFPKKEMHIREIQSLRWSLCQWSYDFNFLIDVFLFHHLCHVPFSFVFGFDDLFLFDTFTFPSFVEVIKLKRFKLQPQTFHISFTSSEATISLGDHFTPSTHFSKKTRLTSAKPPGKRTSRPGTMGLRGQLSAGEILEQIFHAKRLARASVSPGKNFGRFGWWVVYTAPPPPV